MYVVIIQNKNHQRPQTPDDMKDPSTEGPVTDYKLYQNYPNPFNACTNIKFQLVVSSDIELAVYNILGQKVRTLEKCNKPSGRYFINWDGRNDNDQPVFTGIYFLRLIVRQKKEIDSITVDKIIYNKVHKILLVK